MDPIALMILGALITVVTNLLTFLATRHLTARSERDKVNRARSQKREDFVRFAKDVLKQAGKEAHQLATMLKRTKRISSGHIRPFALTIEPLERRRDEISTLDDEDLRSSLNSWCTYSRAELELCKEIEDVTRRNYQVGRADDNNFLDGAVATFDFLARQSQALRKRLGGEDVDVKKPASEYVEES